MKRVLALILALLMLSGCQLARQERKPSQMHDKLVGVFVTFEYLYGEISGKDSSGRIPVQMGDNEWIVPGYEGLSMAHYHTGEYWTGFSTEGLCEVSSHLMAGDDGDTIEEEGTIYVPLDADVMCHMNPVYQTSEGTYYTVPESGIGGAVGTGGMSQSITEEMVWKIDGEERSSSAKFTVAIQGAELAEAVTVVQMSADHKELGRVEYVPGQMPESFAPEANTAYLIVEESGAGEKVRTLYQPGDEFITVYYKGESIWCLPDLMEIQWSE